MIKVFLFIFLLIVHISCGKNENQEVVTPSNIELKPNQFCSVEQTLTGALIKCPDGSSVALFNGLDGANGVDGQNGSNGQDGANGVDGQNGSNGQDGANGADGQDGGSCRVDQVPDVGALISCDNGTTALVEHGRNAINFISEVIDPCGKQASFDEVLLVFDDGKILAHFASGNLQFFTILGAGNYITTDGTSCSFSIDSEGQISW